MVNLIKGMLTCYSVMYECLKIGLKSKRRRIHGVKVMRSYQSRVSKVFRSTNTKIDVFDGRVELDTHADTFVAGRNCLLMGYSERVCDVIPFSDEYEAKHGVPIVKVATGYTNSNGIRYILIFNEALWIPELENSLCNPNQLRDYGIEVQDNPYAREPMFIRKDDEDEKFVVCLKSSGTNIFMDTWTPTDSDLSEYPHIVLTSSEPWNPYLVRFPGISELEVQEIEGRNVSVVGTDFREGMADSAYGDPYHEAIRIFDLGAFSRRICSSKIIETKVSAGPISEDQILPPRTFLSSNRHSNTTPEDLSEAWNISIQQARLTLDATTQHHVRSAIMPLSRRYRMDRMFEPKRLLGKMTSDTMDPNCTSLHGDHRYCQVFGNKQLFCECYPIKTKSSCYEALKLFIREYGAPEEMITDGSREQTGKNTQFQAILRKNKVRSTITQPHRPNQNPAETVIRELRKRWYRAIFRTNCPRVLWNFGLPHFAKIMQLTASYAADLNGRTQLGALLGETPDISQYLDFGWYDWVWYKENAGLDVPRIGKFLGITNSSSNILTFYILPESGIPIQAGTVQRVTEPEKNTESVKERMKSHSDRMAVKFKEKRLSAETSTQPTLEKRSDKERNDKTSIGPNLDEWSDLLEDDPDFADEFNLIYNNLDVPEADEEFDPDSYDAYLSMEVNVNSGDVHPTKGRVTKRLKDNRGNPIGKAHNNPHLDTRMYEVEFVDGRKQAMSANLIAENMFATVDEQGNRHIIMDSIIDHRRTADAINTNDAFVVNQGGNKRRRETTKGWEILIQWKDGSTTWNKMKDVKDSYPVELAEYAIQNKISEQPAFAWWVPYTIKKKARIIDKVKSKYWERTHKYGIRIPKSVKEALEVDRANGDTQWWDSIRKEMDNVRVAFEVYEGKVEDLVGYQKVKCHVIFDVKLGENFRRKARLVAGGHTTETPSSITYSSVVSRDSVRIALTIAALNDLNILGCDIQNAYISAPCREKIFCVAGREFGLDAGKIMIIKRALYGLKSSGAAFRAMLADTIWDLGYRPSKADPDVWLKPATKANGFKYYEMILCYVDDVISISKNPMAAIDGIKKTFKLKNDKAEVPEMYLGAGITKVKTSSGQVCWSMTSDKYVASAVTNVENTLMEKGLRLPAKCNTPFITGYHPSEDTTSELDADGTRYFQELIGVLRWAIELGRVDVLLEVSLLSTQMASPRIGHLQQIYHIFGYLKTSHRRRLFYDPGYPGISESRFQRHNWEDFYKDAKEELPLDMPEARGKDVGIHCFVDASHASDKENRRSQTGILIFVNKAPIICYSKRQNSVETSTFGSEFTAMKQAIEIIKGLRYKLRMFGIPLDGPANIYCDNESVFKNVSIPTSVLNKKMHGISYHNCREAVASGTVRVAKEDTLTNLSDLFTKVLGRVKREELMDRFMY